MPVDQEMTAMKGALFYSQSPAKRRQATPCRHPQRRQPPSAARGTPRLDGAFIVNFDGRSRHGRAAVGQASDAIVWIPAVSARGAPCVSGTQSWAV